MEELDDVVSTDLKELSRLRKGMQKVSVTPEKKNLKERAPFSEKRAKKSKVTKYRQEVKLGSRII